MRLYAGVAVAAAVGLVAGSAVWVYMSGADDPFASCRGGQIAGGAIGGPFELIDETGKTVTDQDVITKPTLVYFGYTFCPDVCPLDNARNAEAVDLLEKLGMEVTPVFISFDPKRDTPAILSEFTNNLHPRMIGLTGSEAQIKAASQAYKTYFKVQDPEDEYYLIDHSTYTYLMMPGTGFLDFFQRDVTAQQMADRVACFLDATSQAD